MEEGTARMLREELREIRDTQKNVRSSLRGEGHFDNLDEAMMPVWDALATLASALEDVIGELENEE